MSPMLRCFLIVAALVARVAAADSPPPSLRTIFSPEEFAGAGLEKLSPAELVKLEAALAAHRAALGAAPPASGRSKAASNPREFGAEQIAKPAAETGTEFHGRIEGTVSDLTGRSVFLLDNGQVWQQRIPDKIAVPRALVNPAVTITRGLGGYKMDVDGMTRTIFVKRIQ
jgi:hypothetical protein